MLKCDECEVTVKHQRNLKRHKEEQHNPNYERWNCTTCNKQFKRRGFLVEHLVRVHGMMRRDAVQKALNAPRGDQTSNRQPEYYETISDDEDIFELLDEMEGDGETVDVDEFLIDDNNNNYKIDGDLSFVSSASDDADVSSSNDDRRSSDDKSISDDDKNISDDDKSISDDDKGISADDKSISDDDMSSSDDELSTYSRSSDGNESSSDSDSVILISDNTSDIVIQKTHIQTVIYSFQKRTTYVNGKATGVTFHTERDFYEQFQ